MMEAVPGATLEVVEAEFLLELLVGLLAGPTRFDRGGQNAERRAIVVIGEVEFDVAVSSTLADEPGFFARQMDMMSGVGAVRDADANGREVSGQPSLGAAAPANGVKAVLAESVDGFA